MTNPRMKITDVRSRNLRVVREVGELEPAWSVGSMSQFRIGGGSFVEIETDQGITGIGSAVNPALIPSIKELLVGKDPFEVEQHDVEMRYYIRGGIGYQGTAGVDIALWDIIGKAAGQPLYKLWGGGKDRIAPYASMYVLSTPEERAEMATSLADEGWKAIKLRLHHQTIEEDLRTFEVVQDAVGDRMTVMVDGNQAQSSGTWQPGIQWDFQRAMDTAMALDAMGCFWLEEPRLRYAYKELAALNNAVAMPIAGGENNVGLHEFVDMVEQNVFDLLQPEGQVLGLTTLKKIGVLAQAYNKQIVPHHGGGNIGVIAHMHLIATWPHAPFMELLNDPPIGAYTIGFSIMADHPVVKDGYIDLPHGPGLGVSIDADLILDD
ncbi:MAG: mandelate racemase/muconate lactonizing enzyme family protein [Dehalococcoidia bacterium]|nr:mandelate racemase/muconate lactonizing enzyme family protein [Dehalococcoidia bacterium]